MRNSRRACKLLQGKTDFWNPAFAEAPVTSAEFYFLSLIAEKMRNPLPVFFPANSLTVVENSDRKVQLAFTSSAVLKDSATDTFKAF